MKNGRLHFLLACGYSLRLRGHALISHQSTRNRVKREFNVKKNIIQGWLFAYLITAFTALAAGDASPACVSHSPTGDSYEFRNSCSYNTFVVYCSTTKKISGKNCGDYAGDASKGTFYTHSFNLRKGQSHKLYKPGALRFGVCKGMVSFGKTVRDDANGNFWCPPPKRLND